MVEVKIDIKNLSELLADSSLCIPPYQRPYTWREEQVLPLLQDIHTADKTKPILLGSIILWKNGNETHIVDGQQRLTTLAIFTQLRHPEQVNQLLELSFPQQVSEQNIKRNAKFTLDFIDRKGTQNMGYPLNQIYFIVVYVPDLPYAFTFFDTQNTRGKKLEDTDILKAHHLRFTEGKDLQNDCNIRWIKIQRDEEVGVQLLLEKLLGQSRKFARKDINEVNIKKEFESSSPKRSLGEAYPVHNYQQAPVFSTWMLTTGKQPELELKYGKEVTMLEDGVVIRHEDVFRLLPFQFTQFIEGGERFFWFTQKYHLLYKELIAENNPKTAAFVQPLLKKLAAYNYSIGTKYVHEVFCGAILFLFDKFGYEELAETLSYLFFAVYWLRFKQDVVQYSSVFKYLRDNNSYNPFHLIDRAGHPGYIRYRLEDFLEGNYRDIRGTRVVRATLADALFKPFNNTPFEQYPDMIPAAIRATLLKQFD